MSLVSVYAIFADVAEAERIGRSMVEERFAACVNILGETRSIYRWNGNIESANEVAAIFKTSDEKADALITRIAAMHSYAVPCIATWPVGKILRSYAEWVEENVR